MYYPAPQNVKLRLEWNTWQKIMNTRDSHTLTQKRKMQINEKIYGVCRGVSSRTPSIRLNGTSVLQTKQSLSNSPLSSTRHEITKDRLSMFRKKNSEILNSILLPSLKNSFADDKRANNEGKTVKRPENREEPFLETVKEDDLFEIKKSYRLKVKILPEISSKQKIQDFKLIGRKQNALYKRFGLKGDVGTPRPRKGFRSDFGSGTENGGLNTSVAVSTEN